MQVRARPSSAGDILPLPGPSEAPQPLSLCSGLEHWVSAPCGLAEAGGGAGGPGAHSPFSLSFMNRRGVSTSPYLGSTSNGYAHPSGTALHYDDVPCINGSVSPHWW